MIRDFIAVLNLIRQNPGLGFDSLIRGEDFRPSASGPDTDAVVADTEEDAAGAQASPETDGGLMTTSRRSRCDKVARP